MGLIQTEDQYGGNFITIYGGKFAQRVPEGTLGGVSRVNKLNKTVTEKFYPSFVGKLVNIRLREGGQYGANWLFSFKDGDEVYHLQLSYSNSFATAFLKMLPNIDVSKEMKVTPETKVGDDNKVKSSLFVSQEGNHIKHAYTKENPNGLPDMEQVMVRGEQQWDDTKRLAFLWDMVQQTILPKLPKVEEENTGTVVHETTSANEGKSLGEVFGEGQPDEDAPF